MAPLDLPDGLADWQQAARVRRLNDQPLAANGRYVLCWLQQALRAHDNPVIDAAVRLGNALRLPVLVYHGVREDYPYASDRLHHFILALALISRRDVISAGWLASSTSTAVTGARKVWSIG